MFDKEGFLEELSDWSPEIAEQIAAREGITLTDSHWEVIELLREFYRRFEASPANRALVKFTAYDFVVYGGLDGVVEHIGADTVMDEEGNPFYEVLVRTHESGIAEDKPIIPGMTVEVDILTGKKSVLAYLMKPVLRAKQYALTER